MINQLEIDKAFDETIERFKSSDEQSKTKQKRASWSEYDLLNQIINEAIANEAQRIQRRERPSENGFIGRILENETTKIKALSALVSRFYLNWKITRT